MLSVLGLVIIIASVGILLDESGLANILLFYAIGLIGFVLAIYGLTFDYR